MSFDSVAIIRKLIGESVSKGLNLREHYTMEDVLIYMGLDLPSKIVEVMKEVHSIYQEESFSSLAAHSRSIINGGPDSDVTKHMFEKVQHLYDITDQEYVYYLPTIILMLEKQDAELQLIASNLQQVAERGNW